MKECMSRKATSSPRMECDPTYGPNITSRIFWLNDSTWAWMWNSQWLLGPTTSKGPERPNASCWPLGQVSELMRPPLRSPNTSSSRLLLFLEISGLWTYLGKNRTATPDTSLHQLFHCIKCWEVQKWVMDALVQQYLLQHCNLAWASVE